MSQQWRFTFSEGTLYVIPNTHRVTYIMNHETGDLTDCVEVYNATWTPPDGKRQKIVITASNLEQLRAPESEVQS